MSGWLRIPLFICFIFLIFWLKGGFSAISTKAPRKGKQPGSKRERESDSPPLDFSSSGSASASSGLSGSQRRFEAAQTLSRSKPHGGFNTADSIIDKRTDTLDDVKRELHRLQEM